MPAQEDTAAAEIRRVRAEIDDAIHGKTMLEFFDRNAAEQGDKPALRHLTELGWEAITWREFRDRAVEAAMGLRALGVGHRDFVAIMARNIPEHVVADAGALYAGATPVSIYNTLAPDQIAYIAGNCGAKVAVLENREFAKRWIDILEMLPGSTHLVLIDDADDFRYLGNVLSWDELLAKGREEIQRDPSAAARAAASVRPEDAATLVYTSGTTGPPKGVVITHRNLRWMLESIFRHFPLPMNMKVISYLPLAHVAERMMSYYTGLHRVNDVYFVPQMTQAVEAAKDIHPDVFLGVPRVWEKAKTAIETALREEPSPLKRAIAARALKVGREAVRLGPNGRPTSRWTALRWAVYDKLVFSKIRHGLGLDRASVVLTGSAACSPDVLEFFHAIGLKIHDTWGMTELTTVATIHPMGDPRIGTVGPPLPGVEIAIASDGEVLCRGGLVTAGYLKRPEATAETYDAEGWVHTGDLGAIDPDGQLRITGRKKELIITAGGKNISPNNIENLVKEHPLVGQVCVVGDGRPYLTLLVTLDAETARTWADEHGIMFTDFASLIRNERVHAEIQQAVDDANRHLSRVEAIKKWTLIPTEWTTESGELTPTLKIKRPVVHERYTAEIERMYSNGS